jgi:hypothetical protein
VIELFIRDRLMTYSDVTSLVAQRVFPSHLPQNVSESAISYALISRVGRDMYHGGAAPYVQSRFQFSCWASDPLLSKQISLAVKSALVGYGGTHNATRIAWIRLENELEFFEDEVGSYMTALDLVILHTDN